jgi:hypothetical protein
MCVQTVHSSYEGHEGNAIAACKYLRLRKNFPRRLKITVQNPPVESIVCPSRIPDPKTATKERGEKNLLFYLFRCHKNHKIENYINFELVTKKMWANLQRTIELYKKLSLSSQNNGFGIRDPEKNLFRIPDLGVKKVPDPGSGSATLVERGVGRRSGVTLRLESQKITAQQKQVYLMLS